MKALKTMYSIGFFFFILCSLRALYVEDNIPFAVGSLILTLICAVGYFYAAESERINR
jgi:hypothetical protein